MRFRRRLVLTIAISLFLCPFLTSCSGFFIQPTITSIYVQPSAATVSVGQSVPLIAYATYSDGSQNQIGGDSVGWTSSATTVATVTSPGGSVTGVAIGSATITAASQGVTGTATVNVTISNITSLVITITQGSTQYVPNANINGLPGTLQFYAYANGSTSNNVTNSVTWNSSNNSTVGSISSGGLLTATNAGTTVITATAVNTTTGQQVTSLPITVTVTQ